jgi:hypothetical protein
MSNRLVQSFKDTIASESSMDLIKEYSELALDSFMSDGVLKNIPMLNTVFGFYKLGSDIRDIQNLKKIAIFINQLSDIPEKDRNDFLNKMDESDKFNESMVEKILLTLDRLDETAKAEMIGNLFKLYVLEAISKEKFLRLSSIVEKALLYDLNALHYRESHYCNDFKGSEQYPFTMESQTALSAYGLMEQFLEERRSPALDGTGRRGIEPKLMLKISSLGRELANFILYDINEPSFSRYISERIKSRRSDL